MSNAIGTGALILSANADRMVAGLNSASNKTREFAASVGKEVERVTESLRGKLAVAGLSANQAMVKALQMKGASSESVREAQRLANALDQVEKKAKAAQRWQEMKKNAFNGLVVGSASALASEGIDVLRSGIKDLVAGSQKFRMELERAAEAASDISKGVDRVNRRADEFVNAAANPADQLAAINKEMFRSSGLAAKYAADVETARAALLTLRESSGTALGKWIGGGLEDAMKEAEQRLGIALDLSTKFKDRLADLSEQQSRLARPSSDPALIGDANKLAEAFMLQRETMFMTASAAEVYKLRLRGATDAMLADAEAAARLLELSRMPSSFVGGASQRGSAEAFSIVARNQNNTAVGDSIQKQMLREAQNNGRALIGIKKALDVGPVLRLF